MSVLVIAEAGVNHNGDLEIAKALVDRAADAGADLVKFQTFKADSLTTSDANMADYQTQNTGEQKSQHALLKDLEMSEEMHEMLICHCKSRGIGFFSTAFDIQSINYLVSIGASRFKVPSGEITNLPYLRHIASFGKPLILSTGMSSLADVARAIDELESAGLSRESLTIMHCNTQYPTPISDVNLRAMISMGAAFGVQVGYSDHTLGTEVSIAAVALGAKIIEKRFTIDRSMRGADHKASLEPEELSSMVRAIRNIELALGDGIKRPTASEIGNQSVARKSLVAAVPIRKGEIYSEHNIIAKRPGTGVSPMRYDEVIGRAAIRDFAIDELIEL